MLAAEGRRNVGVIWLLGKQMPDFKALADAQAGVIVACEATWQEMDHGQLVPMIQQARENEGGAAQDPVTRADTGYGAGADLQAAVQHGLAVLGPPALPLRRMCLTP